MERSVKCVFCKQSMYYRGDPRWEQEITIDYGFKLHDLEYGCYAHFRCAKKVFEFPEKLEYMVSKKEKKE